MADKANTSSLLEAIKSKLGRFDNKPSSESAPSESTSQAIKPQTTNYFNPENQNKVIDEKIVDKTSIGLNLAESINKINEIEKKSSILNNIPSPKESDLDIDDESATIKNISQKISIESKIKEIADEISLEEFESDVEVDSNELIADGSDSKAENVQNSEFKNLGAQNLKPENSAPDSKNVDPIELELMRLEKEIAQKKQQNVETNETVNVDGGIKNYLDSKFEEEVKNIEKSISAQDLAPSGLNNLGANNSAKNDLNSSQLSSKNNDNIDVSKVNQGNDSLNQQKNNRDSDFINSASANVVIQNNSTEATIDKTSEVNNSSNNSSTFSDDRSDSFNFFNNFAGTFSPARDYLAKISSEQKPLSEQPAQQSAQVLSDANLPKQNYSQNYQQASEAQNFADQNSEKSVVQNSSVADEIYSYIADPIVDPAPQLQKTEPQKTAIEPVFQQNIQQNNSDSLPNFEAKSLDSKVAQVEIAEPEFIKQVELDLLELNKADSVKKDSIGNKPSDINARTESSFSNIALDSNNLNNSGPNKSQDKVRVEDGFFQDNFSNSGQISADKNFDNKNLDNISSPIVDSAKVQNNSDSINKIKVQSPKFSENLSPKISDNFAKVASTQKVDMALDSIVESGFDVDNSAFKPDSKNIDKNFVLEKINHNLIHEETAYQANSSIKKLVDAKNMIKNVNNFAQNDILGKIAVSLMEPKLEKWLNENLPNLVEEIVKQEIEKIIPKD